MAKVKVAICSLDSEYRQRFARCFLHHYRNMYDLYVFETLAGLYQEKEFVYHVILMEASMYGNWDKKRLGEAQIILLCEPDERNVDEDSMLVCEEKYQEVYKIQAAIQRVLQKSDFTMKPSNVCKRIGVFSLDCENQQIPYCALLAMEYAERGKTLVVNLQPYSRFEADETIVGFRLEDVMMSVQMENDTRRVDGAIAHEENWDYIYSVKNTECFVEVTDKIFEKMFKHMVEKFGYEYLIINFGAVFQGMHTLMTSCEEFYFLTNAIDLCQVREEQFKEELVQKGYETFKNKIYKMEIPKSQVRNQNWRQIAQQWRWTTVGDALRRYFVGE